MAERASFDQLQRFQKVLRDQETVFENRHKSAVFVLDHAARCIIY